MTVCDMIESEAILICDRDAPFREALRNLLFAAGYLTVDVVGTVREGLAKLRSEHYCYVMVGIPRPNSMERRWATVVRLRQPGARLLFAVPADVAALTSDAAFDYVIKERAFSALFLLTGNIWSNGHQR